MSDEFPREVLLQMIFDSTQSIDFRWKKGEEEARGCHRAEFRLRCESHIADIFFNSASGVRAHYYRSVDLGQDYTRYMLENLASRLLSMPEVGCFPGGIDAVKSSLLGSSSKIWIDESASDLDQRTIDAERLIVLEVPHWVKAARRAAAAFATERQPSPKVQHRALLGVQAPQAELIGVFGAWLRDQDMTEFRVPSKRNRSRQIRAYGFS